MTFITTYIVGAEQLKYAIVFFFSIQIPLITTSIKVHLLTSRTLFSPAPGNHYTTISISMNLTVLNTSRKWIHIFYCDWLILLRITLSRFILVAKDRICIFFEA